MTKSEWRENVLQASRLSIRISFVICPSCFVIFLTDKINIVQPNEL